MKASTPFSSMMERKLSSKLVLESSLVWLLEIGSSDSKERLTSSMLRIDSSVQLTFKMNQDFSPKTNGNIQTNCKAKSSE